MRLRTTLFAFAVAATAVVGVTAPAHARAAGWTYIGEYTSKSKCVDMGQSYQREGWNEYKCSLNGTGWYYLWVR
ncbi:hypothetical protein [Sphaerisporangium fuscum]|uniref:hypothetical protein n=1 Tax=Sphaerisporangium fuscum TaxID=2835868 RepID=UPI001BDCBB8A|nr:hypothetical protein [Sphaerisporangium fuscum]